MNAKRSTHPAAAAAAAALLSLSGAVSTASADGYVIGVSNTITGNGWREEMICSIKAQASCPARSRASTSSTATPMPRDSSKTSATSSRPGWTPSS